ncbi:hypothetical protein TNCV_2319071 [Trichonephila clavipes]|nr:hypothetical protein TNCV_2319071 [Trichonephila clavipes]
MSTNGSNNWMKIGKTDPTMYPVPKLLTFLDKSHTTACHYLIQYMYCRTKAVETSERKKCSFDLSTEKWNNASKKSGTLKKGISTGMSTVECDATFHNVVPYFTQCYPAAVEAIYPIPLSVHGGGCSCLSEDSFDQQLASPKASHTFSMGFRSGERAGHTRR